MILEILALIGQVSKTPILAICTVSFFCIFDKSTSVILRENKNHFGMVLMENTEKDEKMTASSIDAGEAEILDRDKNKIFRFE